MKKRFSKILGVGLTLVMVLALTAGFYLPVGASPDENAWSKFAYPAEGETGGWFYDPEIGAVGPIAKAIDGTLYAYAGIGPAASLFHEGIGTAEWSTDQAKSGSYSAKLFLPIGPRTNQAAVILPYDESLASIPTVVLVGKTHKVVDVSKFYFYCNSQRSGAELMPTLPYIVLDIDTDDDPEREYVLVSRGSRLTDEPSQASEVNVWQKLSPNDGVIATGGWKCIDVGGGVAPTSSEDEPLGYWQDEDVTEGSTVLNVKLWYGDVGERVQDEIAYVDDIMINGVTYDLEGANGTTDPGTALGSHLMKSTDDGRTWAETDYAAGTGGSTIVAIACSSIDEDIVYVADAAHVYKTDDAGDAFGAVAAASLLTTATENITSLAVGYLADDSPFVFFGTEDPDDATGHVYYLNEEAYGAGWEDLKIKRLTTEYEVFGLGTSPDFAHDRLVVAVAASADATFVASNYGVEGDWDYVELEDEGGGNYAITEASDPAFPEDFDADDAYEFFVGVVGDVHTTSTGGVYRVYGTTSDLLDYVNVGIISLDLVGEVGDTLLLAGAQDTADVWWSTDDGDSWDNADVYGIAPSGGGPTYVVMDDDFADNDTAWAATTGAEGAVSLSVDAGEIWHGISLISTDIDAVVGIALSPEYAADETLFLLTSADAAAENTESVLKYDGTNWERVFESTQYGATDEADLVAVSPDFATDETVFIGCKGNQQIFRSTDTGISFVEQRVAPAAITTWTIIDSDTIIAGGNGTIYKTENYGRRAWAAYAITGAGSVASFAVVGETIMVGDAAGDVFVSEDAGETWEQVGVASDIFDAPAALVAFDGDIIYAASGDTVGRCVIDTGEDWADQIWEKFTDTTLDSATVLASGIVIAPDGTLYVVDATADAGVWRCLNPDEVYEDDAVFETITYKLPTGAKLALAGFSVGSNVLWTIDGNSPTDMCAYEDGLATGVILSSPVSGMAVTDTDKATLEWFELTGAQWYEIAVNTRDDFLGTAIDVVASDSDTTELTWVTVTGLDPGTTYYWRVRVAKDEPLLSRYSETRSFISALARPKPPPTMWFPAIGADDVTLSPTFSWDEVVGATSYKITIATEPAFGVASRIVETMLVTNFYPCEVDFSYNTTYYWRVKAYTDSVVVSDWTSGMFTTMPRPVPPTPPVEVTPAPPAPEITVEVPAPQVIEVPPAQVISPTWIYVIIGVGALLVIAVIVLIVRTRRVT